MARAPTGHPPSLDDLLRRRQAHQEGGGSDARPVFVSRARREALRRAEAAEAAHGAADDDGAGRRNPPHHRSSSSRPSREQQGADDQRQQQHHQHDEELERYRRKRLDGEALSSARAARRKLGASAASGPNSKRFRFEWEANEDTSADANSLYARPREASALFGRGARAGGLGGRPGVDDLGLPSRRRTASSSAPQKALTAHSKAAVHWSDKALADLTERDWRIFCEDHALSFRGGGQMGTRETPRPIRAWSDLAPPAEPNEGVPRTHLPSALIGELASCFPSPSPIQMAAVPLGLAGRDVMGVAQTGSGKTLAFALPMLAHIQRRCPPLTAENAEAGPYALVLAPTRELAQQIDAVVSEWGARMGGLRSVVVVGGASAEVQGAALRRGAHVVVATPGRLLDLVQSAYCALQQCSYLVLDEADRMVDMGFEPQLQALLESMPGTEGGEEGEEGRHEGRERTTAMFSATMPPAVDRLARKYLSRPVAVTVGRQEQAGGGVNQRVVVCREADKPKHLARALEGAVVREGGTAIVFANTREGCKGVARLVEGTGLRCAVLFGGKAQHERERALHQFRTKECAVLVATDVAGRGIDVPDVALVVNFDLPATVEAYTHRVGRTGRAGRRGEAISLATLPKDAAVAPALVKALRQAKMPVPPELARVEAANPSHRPLRL